MYGCHILFALELNIAEIDAFTEPYDRFLLDTSVNAALVSRPKELATANYSTWTSRITHVSRSEFLFKSAL